MFIAIGIVLPFLTGQIPEIGSKLLPMHYAVLLSGFMMGPLYGSLIGLITPLLRTLLFQMPPFLTAITMAFELASYGFFTGLFYKKLKMNVYVSLILSMILGRIVWGCASAIIYGEMTLSIFLTGGFINALPGIILQLILIPILVHTLIKANIIK